MRTLSSQFSRIDAARSSRSHISSPLSSRTYAAVTTSPVFSLSSFFFSSSVSPSTHPAFACPSSSAIYTTALRGDFTTSASSFTFLSPRMLFPSLHPCSSFQSSNPSTFLFLNRSTSSSFLSPPSRPSFYPFFPSYPHFPLSAVFSLPSPLPACPATRRSAAGRAERNSSHAEDPAPAAASHTFSNKEIGVAAEVGEAFFVSTSIRAGSHAVALQEQCCCIPAAAPSRVPAAEAAPTSKEAAGERLMAGRREAPAGDVDPAARRKADPAGVVTAFVTGSPVASTPIAVPSEEAAAAHPRFPRTAGPAASDRHAAVAAAAAEAVAKASTATAAAATVAPHTRPAATAAHPRFQAATSASGVVAGEVSCIPSFAPAPPHLVCAAAAVPHEEARTAVAAREEEEAATAAAAAAEGPAEGPAEGAAAERADEATSAARAPLETRGRGAVQLAAETGGRRREPRGTAATQHTSVCAVRSGARDTCLLKGCCSSTPQAFVDFAITVRERDTTTAEGRSRSCGGGTSISIWGFGSNSGSKGSSRRRLGISSSTSARNGRSNRGGLVRCSDWTTSTSGSSGITLTSRGGSSSSSHLFYNKGSSSSNVWSGSTVATNHASSILDTRIRSRGRRQQSAFCFSCKSFSSKVSPGTGMAASRFLAAAGAAALQQQQQYQERLSFSCFPYSYSPFSSSRALVFFGSCSRHLSSYLRAGRSSEGAPVHDKDATEEEVEIAQFHDGSRGRFRPHPFNRRFSRVKTPVFPIEPRNLRLMYKRKAKRRRGRGDKSNAKGFRLKHVHLQAGRYRGPRSRTFEGGKTPLYRRIPKWPDAWLARQRKTMEPLNLSKLRAFIEGGRLDARFPITQRHLHDSRCVKVRNGVRLFNVNDYPFPYKIQIEVSGADQSSIDAIRRVGGEVHIVYRNRLNLRAHVKPYKFEVLPKTARPSLEMLHYLEKMRARGCVVKYIKPQWLIDEEKSLKRELLEFDAESLIAAGKGVDMTRPEMRMSVEEAQEKLLRQFRLRETLAAKLEREQQQQQQALAASPDDHREEDTHP